MTQGPQTIPRLTPGPLHPLLDAANRRLLTELVADPRLPMTELARRVGLSSPTVTERVRRLEEAGVIRGYRLESTHAPSAIRCSPTFGCARIPGSCRGWRMPHGRCRR
jgi:DNA-binding transcriptional ArsR family regulator